MTTRAPDDGARPLRRDAELNRRRTLEAARRVFAERGLAATLDEVAHRAGLGVGTVYRRFADKDALVEALFEEQIRELCHLAEAAATDPDPWTGLASFLDGSSERMAQDRGLRDAVLTGEHGRAGVALARAELGPRLQALVVRAQDSGDLRADVTATDLVTALKSLQVAGDLGRQACPQYWRRHLGIYLDGLRTRRARPSPLPAPPLSDEQLGEAMQTHHRARG
ncbi:TetR/AcrR family transcriptional regulator [Kineococcus indalonis]|uniref:TetR/AcrR family transcriptional regulator n=1 Tax=Kineococcus indalonis TaxID=2696566 RepID=UPI001412B135|nr:TetR/AcrR family transcriptional regulator [Kineococcus indalonis]NAZ87387.1 TetR family transcriptional regulator [Kineococcus indalonis]